MKTLILSFCLVLTLGLAACTGLVMPDPIASATDADCATPFDADRDYFPHQSAATHAAGFDLTYFPHYKVLEVHAPWPGAETGETYLLVQCGAPVPTAYPEAHVIEVPIRSAIFLSSTYLPHLELLEAWPVLVGVDSEWTVYSEEVHRRIADGTVQTVGEGGTIDVEQVLLLEPDLVMTYSLGNPDYDIHPALRAVDQTVLLNGEFLEPHPLGRAEWLKVTAALLNREEQANAYFDDVVAEYETLRELTAALEEKPEVFLNTPWEGVWYMAGGESFMATLLRDAGADYLWSDHASPSPLWLDFEVVYARAKDADVWLYTGQFGDLDALRAADSRFAEFGAFQQGQVYNNDRRLAPAGANDSWEGAVVRPHRVLADLIAILHPHLLPDHEFVYHRRLE